MSRSLPMAFTLVLGVNGLAHAQGTTFPPGYDSTESNAFAIYQGAYADMRNQVAYGDLKGKGAVTMNEMSFRQDGSTSSSTGVGRSWTNVTIQLCETDVATMSATWTANHATTPTTVFNAAHSWPDLTTNPAGSPEPWDNGGLKFPFSSQFIYTSANDMLFDFQFTGGTLANSGAWSGTTSKYPYLDGRSIITSQQGTLYVYGLSSACTFDSSYTGSSTLGGGYGYLVVFSDTSSGNQFRYWNYRTNMPNNTPFIQALSLGGTTSTTNPGPIPGLGCQALQLDVNQMFLTLSFTTNSSGTYSQPTQFAPFDPAAVGIEIWSQGAWNDTVTNAAHLTRTSRCIIPALPPPRDFIGKQVYRYDNTSTTGFGPSETYIPIIRVK